MALTTPILYAVSAFDATQPYTFSFSSIGGSQVVKNRLTIKDNATLAIIYEQTQTTFKFEHIVPANTLTNGTYYQATLVTIDADGNTSNTSAPIQFYCYTAPSFGLTNMPSGNVIVNSSYNFEATYNQEQGEILNAYVFNLYSISGALISTSGTQYNTSATLPLVLSYLFSGFEDKTNYYIEVNGVTAEGTQITTGRVLFTAYYIAPTTYSLLQLANNCKDGYITIRSDVVPIGGVTNPYPATYIDDEEIDLTTSGSYAEWTEGYEVNGGFTLRLWGRNFTPNTEIIRLSNVDGGTIKIKYCVNDTKCWYEMTAFDDTNTWAYVTKSESIDIPEADEQLFCWLRRENNLYDLKIENRGVGA